MSQYTEETQEERQVRYNEAVRIYAYNRQWLSHSDSISASAHRTSVPREIIKRECIRAVVFIVIFTPLLILKLILEFIEKFTAELTLAGVVTIVILLLCRG